MIKATYLIGHGPLLVCSRVSLLGTIITQRWTEKIINTNDRHNNEHTDVHTFTVIHRLNNHILFIFLDK